MNKNKNNFGKTDRIYALSLSSNWINTGVSLVGGKAKMLMFLNNNKFKVPSGFVLTTELFDYFIDQNSLRKYVSMLNIINIKSKKSACKKIRKGIIEGEFPENINSIIKKYISLKNLNNKRIIIRSSVELEDSSTSSFAGQFKSVINVISFDNIIKSIKEVYASAFEERVIKYCEKFSIPINKLRVAVILQEFIIGDISGVAFVDYKNKKLIIEAISGLNEGLVSGRITPSRIFVNLKNKEIQSEFYSKQKLKFAVNNTEGTKIVNNDKNMNIILTESNIRLITNIFERITVLKGKSQDIEWTMKNNAIYILQTRDITVIPKFQIQSKVANSDNILQGYPASSGVITGTVKVIHSEREAIKEGNILVAKFTVMDFLPQIRLSSAIVTEEGGLLSHGAIVARELNKPCVIGVNNATKILKNGEKLTVNGDLGIILRSGASNINIKKFFIDDIQWDNLPYFEKIKSLKINNKNVYYEFFLDKLIVYSKGSVNINYLKNHLKLEKDIKIQYGDKTKLFLYKMYLDNIKDNVTKKLYKNVLHNVNLFDSNKLFLSLKNCLDISNNFIRKAKKIKPKTKKEYFEKLLYLRRAYSIYILVDEYVTKGYAQYCLFRKIKPSLKAIDISFSNFLYKADTEFKFSDYKLERSLNTKILEGIKYYNVIKYWHQNAYPIFANVGAIGNKYSKEMNIIVNKLNKMEKKKGNEDSWYLIALKN